MFEQFTEMLQEILEEEKLFENFAKVTAKVIAALEKEGLSREEAISVAAQFKIGG